MNKNVYITNTMILNCYDLQLLCFEYREVTPNLDKFGTYNHPQTDVAGSAASIYN